MTGSNASLSEVVSDAVVSQAAEGQPGVDVESENVEAVMKDPELLRTMLRDYLTNGSAKDFENFSLKAAKVTLRLKRLCHANAPFNTIIEEEVLARGTQLKPEAVAQYQRKLAKKARDRELRQQKLTRAEALRLEVREIVNCVVQSNEDLTNVSVGEIRDQLLRRRGESEGAFNDIWAELKMVMANEVCRFVNNQKNNDTVLKDASALTGAADSEADTEKDVLKPLETEQICKPPTDDVLPSGGAIATTAESSQQEDDAASSPKHKRARVDSTETEANPATMEE